MTPPGSFALESADIDSATRQSIQPINVLVNLTLLEQIPLFDRRVRYDAGMCLVVLTLFPRNSLAKSERSNIDDDPHHDREAKCGSLWLPDVDSARNVVGINENEEDDELSIHEFVDDGSARFVERALKESLFLKASNF